VNPWNEPRFLITSRVAMLVFVVDQVTKAIVQNVMTTGESIPVMPGLSLTYVRNSGAAFGLMSGVPAPVRLPLLILVTLVAFWVLIGLVRETPPAQRGVLAAIGGVLGGAAGNLVCRVRYGEVIDFVHLHWGEWYWPMFNIADAGITVGVAVILISSLRGSRRGPPSPEVS
jgi:signal peptidase II